VPGLRFEKADKDPPNKDDVGSQASDLSKIG